MQIMVAKMRLLLVIFLSFVSLVSYAQRDELIKLALSDSSNFRITTQFDNKMPAVYYVLDTTDRWNTYRFHLDEDLNSDVVRKRLEHDEHAYYNSSYIFKDTLLNKLFDNSQKAHLYQQTLNIKQRRLTGAFKEFKLIKSFEDAPGGFFFSLSDPLFTSDKRYGFIDIVIYQKTEETMELDETYYAVVLLIYEHIKGKGWTRVAKVDRLIL